MGRRAVKLILASSSPFYLSVVHPDFFLFFLFFSLSSLKYLPRYHSQQLEKIEFLLFDNSLADFFLKK